MSRRQCGSARRADPARPIQSSVKRLHGAVRAAPRGGGGLPWAAAHGAGCGGRGPCGRGARAGLTRLLWFSYVTFLNTFRPSGKAHVWSCLGVCGRGGMHHFATVFLSTPFRNRFAQYARWPPSTALEKTRTPRSASFGQPPRACARPRPCSASCGLFSGQHPARAALGGGEAPASGGRSGHGGPPHAQPCAQ